VFLDSVVEALANTALESSAQHEDESAAAQRAR
jgi:hypothetical protein